jgi:hypothetical protein
MMETSLNINLHRFHVSCFIRSVDKCYRLSETVARQRLSDKMA